MTMAPFAWLPAFPHMKWCGFVCSEGTGIEGLSTLIPGTYILLCMLLTVEEGCVACWGWLAAVAPLTPFWVLTLTSSVIDLQNCFV